jgi:transposase-like protein
MQSEAMKQEELESLARAMANRVKTQADLEAVTRTLIRTLLETALQAEVTDHLGYAAGDTDRPTFVIQTRKGRGSGDATTKVG